MNWWVKAPRQYVRIKEIPTESDIHGMIGDFKIINLLSGDRLFIQTKPEVKKENDLATTLLNRPIVGDVILTEGLSC